MDGIDGSLIISYVLFYRMYLYYLRFFLSLAFTLECKGIKGFIANPLLSLVPME